LEPTSCLPIIEPDRFEPRGVPRLDRPQPSPLGLFLLALGKATRSLVRKRHLPEPTSGSAMAMNADQFRKEAQEARQMADNATSPQDKEFWLHIAEEWLKLAQEAEKPKGSRWW
jgi:hypothetical protein